MSDPRALTYLIPFQARRHRGGRDATVGQLQFPDEFFPDEAELVKPDGTRATVRAQFTGKGQVLTQDVTTAIEAGDELRRTLPNGVRERYRVVEAHFQSAVGGLPAVYTCRVTRSQPEDAVPQGTEPAASAGIRSGMLSTENTVFVVHGRDEKIRDALYAWLRVVGVHVLTWDDAAALKAGTQSNFEIVAQAISVARAVIVLFTPDEAVRLRTNLGGDGTEQYQPRANVLFEAGWALGAHREKTVVVEAGMTHHVSDIDGFNNVRMIDGASLNRLASRLKTAGCALNQNDAAWMDPSRYAALFPAKEPAKTP